ncbi:hypothetical protein HMH01_13935 [Halovulum dunhuangense]|uniref:Uncharacterized protein n=1 Tax=Halovulum dunhuangense TaxID=1505036 RepID=A0A849L5A0_9RHOB|nr:hypothetical protein [Halovulum dunhuangense]NNU81536.1 hypothetical protein [Halovulum dunhuangense]
MCLLRAERCTSPERGLLRFLRPHFGRRLACALDVRHRRDAPEATPVLELSDAAAAAEGLYLHPRWPWRCGDYALILARRRWPRVAHFWLVEPDVHFGFATAREAFALLDESDADLVAHRFGPAGRDWRWHASMAPHAKTVHACFFPLVRVSARLIDAVAARRRAMARLGPDPDLWPNDEAVVATAAGEAGWKVDGLAARLGPDAVALSFVWRGERVHRLSRLQAQPPDGRLYHPAYGDAEYFRHIHALLREQEVPASATPPTAATPDIVMPRRLA